MTWVPIGVYFAALPSMFRTICSTYVSSPATIGRSARQLGLDVDAREPCGLLVDDPREQAAGLERLGLDRDVAALRAGQHEQVLDEPVQPLGLGRDVVDQLGLLLGAWSGGPAGPGSGSGRGSS